MEITPYALFCIVCFAACIYTMWDDGADITLFHFAVILVCSVIPFFNVAVLFFAIGALAEKYSYDLKRLNIVFLKGKKNT